METFKIIRNNKDWKQAVEAGYTTLISGVDYNNLGDGYIACTWDNLNQVFKEITGHEYDQEDGTFGSAMPITETSGHDSLFDIDLHELAELHNLAVIETTQGINGYPKNTGFALMGFDSWSQLEQLAQEHTLEIVSLHRRDGWHFWENKGRVIKPYENSSDDYGDNYSEVSKMDEEEFLKQEVMFFFEDEKESFDQIESFLKTKKEIWEEVEKMEDDEVVITHEGRYYETIKKHSLYFCHDTHNYRIALVVKN
jgi:hypothetical protein